MRHPTIAQGYLKQKIEDCIEDKDKKTIKEKFPDVWDDCKIELTPRLIIKRN